jgi:endonuclease YncB( thermonuclease family)
MNPLLECMARRSEKVTIGAVTFTVKELNTAADVAQFSGDPDYSLKVLVRCVYVEDGDKLAFSDEDIPDIKEQTSLFRLSDLVRAVHRVNGMDAEETAKNSEAANTQSSS